MGRQCDRKLLRGALQERRMRVQQRRHRRGVHARVQVHRHVEIHHGLPEHVELRLIVEHERLCARLWSV